MSGDRLSGVVCDGKYGRWMFHAKTFINTTGDGDVAYYAGVPMRKGRESDGVYMPTTVGFVLANVDEDRLFRALGEMGYKKYTDAIKSYKEKGFATSVFYSFDRTTIPGVVSVNNGGQFEIGVIDATYLKHINVSHRSGLQVAIDFVSIVRKLKLPGLENCSLVNAGPELGIRETRRIEGEYTLTLEDAQTGVEFPDVVARRYGTIDPGGLREDKDYHGSIKDGHAYPYRWMLPKAVDGLLVAGRCASLSHLGLTVCKSMGNMIEIGQAAGVAGALCAKEYILPRALDVSALQARLRDMSVQI